MLFSPPTSVFTLNTLGGNVPGTVWSSWKGGACEEQYWSPSTLAVAAYRLVNDVMPEYLRALDEDDNDSFDDDVDWSFSVAGRSFGVTLLFFDESMVLDDLWDDEFQANNAGRCTEMMLPFLEPLVTIAFAPLRLCPSNQLLSLLLVGARLIQRPAILLLGRVRVRNVFIFKKIMKHRKPKNVSS